jgi:hypothetical protein
MTDINPEETRMKATTDQITIPAAVIVVTITRKIPVTKTTINSKKSRMTATTKKKTLSKVTELQTATTKTTGATTRITQAARGATIIKGKLQLLTILEESKEKQAKTALGTKRLRT